MEKFVCVRIVQGWGLDLALFQFDNELTWAVFLMNADKTIYGRYGTRSDHKDTTKDISMDGLKQAMEGALELHKGYPANKKEFAGKVGAAPAWRTPEMIPELAGKPNTKPADGTRGGCIHCHQANDAAAWSLRRGGQPITDRVLWPFPMPDPLGFSLDSKEKATVTTVVAGSPAEKAGVKSGDKITRMEGQPILSIADVQWVLHNAKEPGSVKLEVDRGGQKSDVTVPLAVGWRHKDDFSWRVITWSMRHRLMGTEPLETLPADEKKKLGVAENGMAIRVKGFPPDWVKDKNKDASQKLQKGDVIVEADGKKNLATESEFLAYLMQKKSPGQAVDLLIVRGGKPQRVTLSIP